MNFLQDRKNQIRRKNIFQLIVGILFVFLIARFGFPDFTYRFFSSISSGIAKGESYAVDDLENISKRFVPKRTLIKENEKLRSEVDVLSTRLLDYQIIKDENNDLKQFIGGFENIESFKVGRVVSRPPVTFYDTVLLDIGEDDGVFVGASVYINNNIIIGNVLEVYKNTSLVSLYTSPKTETKGILIPSNTEITLIGRGGGSYEANIPRDLTIEEGSIVTFPGKENDILAIALSNISDPRDSLNTVLFRSPVNYNNIRFVGIR